MQAYEWYSIVKIIKYQKNRSMNEILFEVNNTSEDHKLFKRNEKRRKCLFMIIMGVYIITYIYSLYDDG